MAIDEILFARLRDRFTTEWKKVEHVVADRRVLTTNLTKRAEYRDKLTNAFNDICGYLQQIYRTESKTDVKLECIARITPYTDKCKKAFVALKLQYRWPIDSLTLINVEAIQSIEEPLPPPVIEHDQATGSTVDEGEIASSTGCSEQFEDAQEEDTSNLDELIQNLSSIDILESQLHTPTVEGGDQTERTIQEDTDTNRGQANAHTEQAGHTDQSDTGSRSDLDSAQNSSNGSDEPNSNLNQNLNTNTNTMVQTPQEFFATASKILNYKFEGDPLKLQSFLEDVELVEEMAQPETAAVCLKFIKSRITGVAREQLPEDINTIQKITDALKKNVKYDSSKVIEGRLIALRISKGNVSKFAEEAERLSEAFERSLVDEKFTRTKAKELTIAKAKELCRKVTRSDVVEGIIASTKYESPKEVIAAFITESDYARKKKQEQQNYQKRSNDNKGHSKGQKFDKNKKFQKYDNKGQNKGKFQKNRGDNQGGKGRSNRNEHTIRIVNDAGSPTTSRDSSNNGGEQVFRLAQS